MGLRAVSPVAGVISAVAAPSFACRACATLRAVLALLVGVVVSQAGDAGPPVFQLLRTDAGVLEVTRAADGRWRDRYGLREEVPPGVEVLSDPLVEPVRVGAGLLQPPTAHLRVETPVAGLSWGMTPDEVSRFAGTSFVREAWPVRLGGRTYFATPTFVLGLDQPVRDGGVHRLLPALGTLGLRPVTGTSAEVRAALVQLLGPVQEQGDGWSAWTSADTRVHLAQEAGKPVVLMTSRLWLRFHDARLEPRQ